MKIATISELKKELSNYSVAELRELCLRLAKYKKESKELLHYLVFEASDEESYIAAIKEEIQGGFEAINKANLCWAKKTIRKVLRILNKYIRFSGKKQTEVELRLFFCDQLIETNLAISNSQVLVNLYNGQLRKIEKALSALHPDLQFDYEEDLQRLQRL